MINSLLAEFEGILVIRGLFSFDEGKSQIFIINLTIAPINVKKGDRLSGIKFLDCELEGQDTPECFTVDMGNHNNNEPVTKALNDTLGVFPVHFTQGRNALMKLFTAFPGVFPS